MAESTRNTRVAVVEEASEGTATSPASGSDFVAVQADISLSPGFETLENAELKGSIGNAKPIQGLESPSATFSHYLVHSGSEGVAPESDLLFKSAFGDSAILGTERDTVGGSTAGTSAARATVVVDAGEGADFERGAGLMIQGPTSASGNYDIRCVRSISTDTLSLNFNLDSAPASGIDLGTYVLYKPANTGHIPLSFWAYMANGGATQMISGGQVVEMSIDATANSLINTNFTLEGDKYHMNPMEVTSSSNKLDFTDDGGAKSITALVAQIYRDPHEAASALEAAFDAASVNDITVIFNDRGSDAGKFTVSSDGATFEVDWLSTTDTLGAVYGFTADDTGALSYVSDAVQDYSSPFTPSLDGSDPLTAKNHEVLLGSFSDFECIQDGVQSVNISLGVEKPRPGDICAESGRGTSVPNNRTITVDITAILKRHDADDFKSFRANDNVEFQYAFGTKDGGNWVEGKSGVLYIPDATISSFEMADADGIVVLNMTVTAFVDNSGNGEFYLNFL